MLEIFVNNQKVDLPPDIQLSLTIENPFVLQDRIPTPYSLTFELPTTSRNLKIFRNPARIPSYLTALATIDPVPCTIYFQSLKIAEGVLNTDNYEGGIRASFLGVEFTEGMRRSLFSNQMDAYSFPTSNWFDINFDDPSNYAYRYRKFALDAAAGNDSKSVVAPIKMGTDLLDFIYGEFKVSYGEAVTVETVAKNTGAMMDNEYIDFYNPATSEFMLRWPPSPPPLHPAIHAPIFPHMRLGYILDSLFGDRLDGNFFKSGELSNLVVPSLYFPNWYRPDEWIFVALYRGMMFENTPGTMPPHINTNSFLASSTASDFIKQVMRMFCCTILPFGGRFELRHNRDILNAPPTDNWDSKLIGIPKISAQKSQRYRYGYSSESEFKVEGTVKTVASVHEMIADDITPPTSTEVKQVYHITTTGQLFRKIVTRNAPDDESEDPVIVTDYELLDASLGFPDEDSGADAFDATSELTPLPTKPCQYWWTAQNSAETHPETDWWSVPYWEGDRRVRPEKSGLMFFRGMTPAPRAGHSYPLLTPYDVSPAGDKVGNLSLKWEGPTGLVDNFHTDFRAWVEKNRVKADGMFLVDAMDLHKLDITTKKHLHGRNFFFERIRVTIHHNRIDPAHVEFIEA